MVEPKMNAIFGVIEPLQGYHEVEEDVFGPFVWSMKCFSMRMPRQIDFLLIRMCYYADSGKLSIKSGGAITTEIRLFKGWNTYTLELSEMLTDVTYEIDF